MCFTGMSREGCRWMMLPVVCVHRKRERKSSGGYGLDSEWGCSGQSASWSFCGGGEGRGGEGRGGEGRGGKSKFAILNSSCNVAILNAIKCAW